MNLNFKCYTSVGKIERIYMIFLEFLMKILVYLHGIYTERPCAHENFPSHMSDTCHIGTLIHIPFSTDYP
jgi:hypothetical protein